MPPTSLRVATLLVAAMAVAALALLLLRDTNSGRVANVTYACEERDAEAGMATSDRCTAEALDSIRLACGDNAVTAMEFIMVNQDNSLTGPTTYPCTAVRRAKSI